MKRRSFFQRVIGGFAAACGVRAWQPETLWQRTARQYREGRLSRVDGFDWYADQMVPTITATAPPNVAVAYNGMYFPGPGSKLKAGDTLTFNDQRYGLAERFTYTDRKGGTYYGWQVTDKAPLSNKS